ncbi:YncE family protein [Marilutibacter chinensis]|uniref:YncE family protein n=1 Tax=Marilutibacter chinensis TaxID=2912247 RepID=A0ABS9HY35_9GAMM|nr:YncE family protein [Lysobacter chinensis]MCF7223466.1 YncE family protein [Lysobacter chinensis]
MQKPSRNPHRRLPAFVLPLLAALLPLATDVTAGELMVGNKSADSVWFLSLEDGRRTAVAQTDAGPHEIAVSPDGRRAAITNYGAGTPGHTLTVLDLAGAATPRTIDLGPHGRPHGVRFLPDSRRLVVTTEASGHLLVVDLDAGADDDPIEAAIGVGEGVGHMVALSDDGSVAYVSKIAAGTVSRVDLAKARKTGERTSGEGAEGIAFRRGHGELWVSNRAAGTVTVHDPVSLEVLHTLESPGFPIRIVFTADGRHALVTNARAGELAVFDADSKSRVATVGLLREDGEYRDTLLGRDALPIGVIADPQRPRVYVAISGADEIAVIDTGDWKVVDRWATGREPDALGVAE